MKNPTMVSINMIMTNMKLDYEIRTLDQKRCVYLWEPSQHLDADELAQWMTETRDDLPDLYATLVAIYFQLRKSNYTKEG